MGAVRFLAGCSAYCWFALGSLFWSSSSHQIFCCPRRRCHDCLPCAFWRRSFVTFQGRGFCSDGRRPTSSNDWFLCLLVGRYPGAWSAYLGWPKLSVAQYGDLLTDNQPNKSLDASG